jgi:hypothetical protein
MSKSISLKMFLNRAVHAKSAEAFLEGHREWLENGELADEAMPILAKLDAKEVLPAPSLEALCQLAASHMIAQFNSEPIDQGERQSRSSKPYVAVIKNALGNVVVVKDGNKEKELRSGFDRLQDAEGWVQRRLSETSSIWNGEVTCAKVLDKDGAPVVFKTTRENAIRAQAPKKKSAFMHTRRGSGGLSNTKVPVNPTHVRFSRG